MCGRFTIKTNPADLARIFDAQLTFEEQFGARYNVAPTQTVLTVRQAAQPVPHRELVGMRWGLIPSWAKDPKIGSSLINARAETVSTKPAFRAAYKSRRCLVVCDGFYEWRAGDTPKARKQPFYITLTSGRPLPFAGLYETWRDPDGQLLNTCSILTTTPNDLMAGIHNRMPVILPETSLDLWLDPAQTTKRLDQLLVPYPASEMRAWPVDTLVNSPRNEHPQCIEPLTAPA